VVGTKNKKRIISFNLQDTSFSIEASISILRHADDRNFCALEIAKEEENPESDTTDSLHTESRIDKLITNNFKDAYSYDQSLKFLYHFLIHHEHHPNVKTPMKNHINLVASSHAIRDGLMFKRVKVLRKNYLGNEDRELLVVPRGLINEVIKSAHNDNAHFGATKILPILESKYTWPNMRASVVLYCKSCPICQKKRIVKRMSEYYNRDMGCLRSAKIGDVWSMDIVSLPTTQDGFKYCLVATEHFTRYVVIVPLKKKDAERVALAWYNHVILKYGVPLRIITDQGGEFCGLVTRQLIAWTGSQHLFISIGNPAANGVTERFNRVIVNCLIKFELEKKDRDWVPVVRALEFQSNTSYSPVISGVPSTVFFARKLVVPSDLRFGKVHRVESSFRHSLHTIVAANAEAQSEAISIIENIHNLFALDYLSFKSSASRLREYEVGSLVLVKDGDQINSSVAKWVAHSGPYEVVNRLSDVDYLIQGADGVPCWISSHRLQECIPSQHSANGINGLASSAVSPAMRILSKTEAKKLADSWIVQDRE
jgi:transposase InsO family protein